MGQGFGMAEGPRNAGKVGNPYWVEGDTWLTKLALQPLVAVLFGFR